MAQEFEILEGFEHTSKYLDQVRAAADSDKVALGFLQFAVYDQFARKGGLYVLVTSGAAERAYAGHLLFDRRFPRAHVRQMYVAPEYRGKGLAKRLLRQLKASLAKDNYISIYARVAEDLKTANAFWHGESFYIQRTAKGGETKNRLILVRCHELDSPQLFPKSGVSDDNPLGLEVPSPEDLPIFLLDLNVLFDLNPRRQRREVALGLFQAERMSVCGLAISTEIRSELTRTASKDRQTDPMAAYLDIFPCFPIEEGAETETLLQELSKMVFPAVPRVEDLTPNQRSDLKHVITAIRNSLAGLITNDGAILLAAADIEKKYGILILSPEAFQLDGSSAPREGTFEISKDDSLSFRRAGADQEPSVRALLLRSGFSGSLIASGWLPPETRGNVANRFGVWSGTECVAYATWPAWSPSGVVNVKAIVDEGGNVGLDAARVLLMQVTDRVAVDGPRRIRLDLPSRQSNLREVAAGLGFRAAGHGSSLIKSALGCVVTPRNWQSIQQALASASGPSLPARLPVFRDVDQQVELFTPNGNRVHLSIDQLETLLAPALFALPGRKAVITPVRREFSESLFGHSPQTSLLPAGTAALFHDKHFLSSPQSIRHFKRGTLVLFYESQKRHGAAAIVAMARVRQAYLKRCDALTVSDLRASVLDKDRVGDIGVAEEKVVTVFDNVFRLKRHVSLNFLKAIGCGRPNDVITTRPISSDQLEKILEETFGSD